MRKPSGLLATLLVLSLTSLARGAVQKYDVKSAVVTLENVMTMGKFAVKTRQILYFDDYGLKECKETYQDGKLEEIFFSDGKELYSLKPATKKAFRRGPAARGTELRVELGEMGTKRELDSGLIKAGSPMTLAGQTCQTVEVRDKNGALTLYAGWNKVMVFMQKKSKAMSVEIKAVKIEPNAAVPAEKFKLPAGYALTADLGRES